MLIIIEVSAFLHLPEICRRFNKNKVKYVLVGGCAVILHGLPRETMDIDFVIEVSRENIENIKKALKDIVPEIEELNFDLLKEYDRKKGVIRIGTDKNFYIDLLPRIADITYEKLIKNAEIMKVNDEEVKVAGLDDLIETKKTVREQDKKDLLFLIGRKEYLSKND